MHIADHDFRQKAILPGDAIRFDNLGRINKHLGQPFYFTGHSAHSHMRRNAEAEGFGIDCNRISPDRARIFQLVNTLGYPANVTG